MTDLDFDELDRAVNSLINSRKTNDKSAAEKQTQNMAADDGINEPASKDLAHEDTSSASTSDIAVPSTKQDTDTTDQTSSSTSDEKTDSQIQKRTKGLYMDMMPQKQQPTKTTTLQSHGVTSLADQSSDLAVLPAKQESSKKLAPFHDIIPPQSSQSSSGPTTDQSPEPEPLSPQAATASDDSDILQSQLEAALQEQADQAPDQPLAETGSNVVSAPATNDTPGANVDSSSDLSDSTPSSEQEADTKTPEPVGTTSPFLADAKVDKRPLGGVTLDESAKESTDDEVAEEDPGTSANPIMPSGAITSLNGLPTENNQPAVPAPVPPEFHEDLLAVEADKHKYVTSEKLKESQDTEAPAPAAQIGPISIAQQYKEKTSTGDQSHTPIYDTNVQPLSHPAHKKSGWWAVVLIVGVIALSVGIAATLYFTGIL